MYVGHYFNHDCYYYHHHDYNYNDHDDNHNHYCSANQYAHSLLAPCSKPVRSKVMLV